MVPVNFSVSSQGNATWAILSISRARGGARGRYVLHVPSFSSKRGHVTVKHVLTGRKHDKLGNQTFEVLALKRTVHTIPFTYFTY